ncbi:MAG: hypothetical protein RLZ51_1088 [Pseudomonadota bacterium]
MGQRRMMHHLGGPDQIRYWPGAGLSHDKAMNMRPAPARHVWIDVLKVLASQCIVLHHLSIYGPMPERVAPLAPGLIAWLDVYGRYAVQVFLVIGGFLAAASLCSRASAQALAGESPIGLLRRLAKRYWRLAPTLWASIALALLVTALIRFGLGPEHTPDHTPQWPAVAGVFAQMLMLQDVLDIPALSAGVWYVAIDLQLHALLLLMLWLAHKTGLGRMTDLLVFTLTAVSLLVINRDTAWEIWAPYFFGAYGLGFLAWRATQETGSRRNLILAGMAMLVTLALWLDWRDRIALAALVALALVVMVPPRSAAGWISRRGAASYSLFLVHYPVCLAMNALATFLPPEPVLHAGLLVLTWILSNLAGQLMYRQVESRF